MIYWYDIRRDTKKIKCVMNVDSTTYTNYEWGQMHFNDEILHISLLFFDHN